MEIIYVLQMVVKKYTHQVTCSCSETQLSFLLLTLASVPELL